MSRFVQIAFGLATLYLLGDAAFHWLKVGWWQTPNALAIAVELGAWQWAREPKSWMGLHSLVGGTPIWVLTAIICALASAVIEGRREI